ncbi:hypothetical protein PSHT_15608 [Puccinia striiformis]|uniref:DUF4218 domain-containing protein n=1 Tax=Puccinia striiformis TaxID=27350 RepID=A0A2S4UE59_9BASI|nr:hypothetical protein PSHT_15608 [Puccinia striiformis]
MALKKKSRAQTRVCTCVSFNCGTFSFRNDLGEVQQGVELTLKAIKRHAVEDSLIHEAQNDTEKDHRNRAYQSNSDSEESASDEFDELDNSELLQGHQSSQSAQSNIQLNLPAQSHLESPQNEPDSQTDCSGLGHLNSLEIELDGHRDIYDCSSFFSRRLLYTHPTILYSSLFAAVCHILNQASAGVSSYILKSQIELLKITLSHGVLTQQSPRQLKHSEQTAIANIPVDIRTVVHWLQINPRLNIFICCRQCFALYNTEDAPDLCSHSYIQQENCAISSKTLPKLSRKRISDLSTCNYPLFKPNSENAPIRQYATQDLPHWIARMFSRPDIEEALETSASRSRQPYNPHLIKDIQDSRLWKEFSDPDGHQFTAQSRNLVFGMFTDGINPYGNRQAGKHVSCTFFVLVCLSLPFEIRRRPENVFLAGIAPGPQEPSLELVNSILRPIVSQLNTLWKSGLSLSQTFQKPSGRHIFAALLPFFSDLPALRRSLGFASAVATRMCSFCLLTKDEINNIDSNSWRKRTIEEHRIWATEYQQTTKKAERKKLLEERGVRYSELLKLDYWNIIDYHVVDSMHNLLLGLLNWHCRRLWQMSEKEGSKKIAACEKKDLVEDENPEPKSEPKSTSKSKSKSKSKSNENSNPSNENTNKNKQSSTSSNQSKPNPQQSTSTSYQPIPVTKDTVGPTIHTLDFGSNTDPSDATFNPYAVADQGDDDVDFDDDGWGGEWTPPSDSIVFDDVVVSYINNMLPRIHIPTWIKRAIPVLGKASFGRLKADEWRNLFTIQLALVLPALWKDPNAQNKSLLHNFAHLVSLVNIALARSTSISRIDAYRHHIKSYIQSSLLIFEDVELAPNHHMAIHLADCLERFGPTRAWWSFPMERLMSDILKSPDNNQISQMEITFMEKFCQMGNLRALLDTPGLPASIQPHISQLKSLFEPIPFKPEIDTRNHPEYLDSHIFNELIEKLNDQFSLPGKEWVSSTEFCQKDLEDRLIFSPTSSQVILLKNHPILDVNYSTHIVNKNNSVVALKPGLKAAYGQIESIFKHSRGISSGSIQSDVFFLLKPLMPVPMGKGNPYSHLSQNYEMRLSLRIADTEEPCILFHENEILCHCAWIKYNPGELSTEINFETLALVVLDRS